MSGHDAPPIRTGDLLDDRTHLPLDPGAVLLGGLALARADAILSEIAAIAAAAPFRHMQVPGGGTMSVAMTNAGPLGWASGRSGYHYTPHDPETGHVWPPIGSVIAALAGEAAAAAGFPGFAPDACLVNRYEPGARMALHQDRDETDFAWPIVSVSLGLDAVFLWGAARRQDRARRIALRHGDVVVWGGPARLAFHGVAPLKAGVHPDTGAVRYNLTLRRAA